MKKVVVSGYFNPMHIGHIRLLKEAKSLGDYLVVILNNDEQVKLKGSVPFMNIEDRKEIVEAIKYVDEVFISIDKDKTICKSLEAINPDIFANGGDRNQDEIPESKVCRDNNIEMIDNVGGDKIRSSSILIKEASKKHD